MVLRAAERTPVPWKNGGGTTWPVASGPAGADLTGFDWRISIAEIAADGPFSSFPGIDRTIALVDGSAVELTVDGVVHVLQPGEPFRFSGDAVTSSRQLAGPSRDLNLMTRGEGSMQFVAVDGELSTDAQCVVVIAGAVDLVLAGETHSLGPLDAALLTGRATLRGEQATAALLRW